MDKHVCGTGIFGLVESWFIWRFWKSWYRFIDWLIDCTEDQTHDFAFARQALCHPAKSHPWDIFLSEKEESLTSTSLNYGIKYEPGEERCIPQFRQFGLLAALEPEINKTQKAEEHVYWWNHICWPYLLRNTGNKSLAERGAVGRRRERMLHTIPTRSWKAIKRPESPCFWDAKVRTCEPGSGNFCVGLCDILDSEAGTKTEVGSCGLELMGSQGRKRTWELLRQLVSCWNVTAWFRANVSTYPGGAYPQTLQFRLCEWLPRDFSKQLAENVREQINIPTQSQMFVQQNQAF